MPRRAEATRERILTAAHRMFFRQGFTRVGMDEIAKAAGLTKRTLYHHFDSKDALLAAMLEHQAELSVQSFAASFAKAQGSPSELVDALFGELAVWAGRPGYLGSGFTRLALELCDLPGHPAMRFARAHKATVEALLARRLAGGGAAAPGPLARQFWILMEGAMVLALLHGEPAYMATAAEAAGRLAAEAVSG